MAIIHAQAPILEADFNGSSNQILATGGTATGPNQGWTGTNTIATTNGMGNGSYISINVTSSGSQGYSACVETPESVDTSLGALTVYDGTFTQINGAVDFFQRMELSPTGTVGYWYRPLDESNGSDGLRITICNPNNDNTHISAGLSGPNNTFVRESGSTGSVSFGTSGQSVSIISTTGFALNSTATSHVAVTFRTDGSDIVTMSLYGVNSAGQIDTTSSSNLLGQALFKVTGSTTFATGPINFPLVYAPTAKGTAFHADYDQFRIYDQVTGTLSGILPQYKLTDGGDTQADGTHPTHNCVSAFNWVFANEIIPSGGGQIVLSTGTYLCSATGSGYGRSNVICPPANTEIYGQGQSGSNQTVLTWSTGTTSTLQYSPVLFFLQSDGANFHNAHVQYTGVTFKGTFQSSGQGTFGDVTLLKSMNTSTNTPYNFTNWDAEDGQPQHCYMMVPDTSSLAAFSLIWDSKYATIHDVTFDSATEDVKHCYNGAIYMGGSTLSDDATGTYTSGTYTFTGRFGFYQPSVDNAIRNVTIKDFTGQGMFACGQQGALLQNLTFDHRGFEGGAISGTTTIGNAIGATHCIYFNHSQVKDGAGNVEYAMSVYNNQVTVDGLTENPDLLGYSDDGNTGTAWSISLKETENSKFSNIASYHPAGIFGSIQNISGCTFDTCTWTSETQFEPYKTYYTSTVTNPVIHQISDNTTSLIATSTNTWTNIDIDCENLDWAVNIDLTGVNSGMNYLTIKTPPLIPGGGKTSDGVVRVSSDNTGSKGWTFGTSLANGIFYTPLGITGTFTSNYYNTAFGAFTPEANNTVYDYITWTPSSPPPTSGNGSNICKGIFQDNVNDHYYYSTNSP